MSSFRPSTPRLRALAPILLLGVSTVLTAVLAWQAYGASASHRALAEQVLRDYASLAASEFSRRATAFIGNYGVTIVLDSLTSIQRTDGQLLPTRAHMQSVMQPQSRGAVQLVASLFWLDAHTGEFHSDTRQFSRHQRDRLLQEAKEPGLEPKALLLAREGSSRWYVMTPVIDATSSARRWLGFEASQPAVVDWLQKFATSEPLLPPALIRKEARTVPVYITLRDPHGRVWFRAPQGEPPPAIAATRAIGGTPAVPGFSQFTVEAAIESSAAGALIIGGLPHDQTPLLIGLVLLSAALTTAAILQLRGERRATSMRQDFVARASHELRTPVARMRMFAETLLLDRVRSEVERRDTIEALDRGARRLSLLIDNVLRMSGQQRGSPTSEHVDLVTLTRETIADFNAVVGGDTGIRLAAPEQLAVRIDREALRQILMNLLDNAWKYGGEPAQIVVTIQSCTEQISIVVADRGPGIPSSERSRIWQPYTRLDRERTSSIAGTGIGLAVVRDLVHSGGGRCWTEANPDGGARFVVSLPRSAQSEV